MGVAAIVPQGFVYPGSFGSSIQVMNATRELWQDHEYRARRAENEVYGVRNAMFFARAGNVFTWCHLQRKVATSSEAGARGSSDLDPGSV